MIDVGKVMPADALYMAASFPVLADCGNWAHFHGRLEGGGVHDHRPRSHDRPRSRQGGIRPLLRAVFGLEYNGPVSHFAPVRINDTLTIDFDNWDTFERHHYAFKVSEAEFDGIFDRVRAERIAYGSGPRSSEDMAINHRHGGRGFYFRDPNGHLLEVLTA